MGKLNRATKLGEFDETYNALLKAFNKFPEDRQLEYASMLFVILCSHISDKQVIDEAIAVASKAMDSMESERLDESSDGCSFFS